MRPPGVSEALAASLKLAGSYLAAGQAKDAIAQYRRVLTGRERALGPGHPDTLAARASMAAALRRSLRRRLRPVSAGPAELMASGSYCARQDQSALT